MGFGSDDFFEKLKTEVMDPNGDGSIYYMLDREVKNIVYPMIKRKVAVEFVDDIYQEIFFSVWRNLASFMINMECKSEGERVAWLLTVTKRRIADFYEKYAREKNNKIYLEDIEYEMENKAVTQESDNNEFTFRMREALFHLFSVSTSPEKIISFVYSKIILSSETCSGKPSITAEYLKGYSLFELFEKMKEDLEIYLEVSIPDNVYMPLYDKLLVKKEGELVGNRIYQLNVKTIVDGTNRIQKKMEAKKCR